MTAARTANNLHLAVPMLLDLISQLEMVDIGQSKRVALDRRESRDCRSEALRLSVSSRFRFLPLLVLSSSESMDGMPKTRRAKPAALKSDLTSSEDLSPSSSSAALIGLLPHFFADCRVAAIKETTDNVLLDPSDGSA